ncbi:MAG TPA: RHS repeat-associated core domain-containing protein [Polyangiaceae bacterium]|nr:RHS repeat-associated core domain-containing protein [Polyangiaceae bacterium]
MQKRRLTQTCTTALTGLLLITACGGDPSAKKPAAADSVEADCADGADNDGDGVTDCDDLDCRATSKSCELAPQLDRTVPTTVWEAAQFLFSGKDPIQKETSAKAFSKKRIAILRGKVVDTAGEPLAGVRVAIARHDEWGYTVTRPDGVFDLAVEGGSQLLVQFSRDGFLTAERGLQAAWRSYESVPELGLVEAGKAVTKIAGEADREQVAVGDAVEDALGRRQPVVVFVSNTTATATLPDGTEEQLARFNVRLAEYPFEPPTTDALDEPARFAPGTAPRPASLNWGIEATIDEAEELGATRVDFSTPASILVENFLGLPTGSPIPLGYYQRGEGNWQGEAPGRVIEILGVTDGEADVDADGDGEADDEDTLLDLHVYHGVRRELARRYEPGAKIWHLPVWHFSPHSADIATVPPPGAVAPTTGGAMARPLDEPTRHGSLLVERGALGEAFSLGLAGTPYSLRYQSDRGIEYRNGFRIEFPAIGDEVPEGLKRVSVRVNIAGQTLRQTLDPKANVKAELDWNGKDAFGRTVQGQQRARVTLSYIYDGELRPAATFGATSRLSVTSEAVDDGTLTLEAALTKRFNMTVGTFDASGYQLGGLGLDVLHAFDPGTGKIYFGSGDERSAENVALVTTRPAGDAVLGTPDGVFAAPDGSVIISQDDEQQGDLGRLLQLTPDGEVFALAGEGALGDAADLVLGSPQGIAMKSDGSVIVADFVLDAIREIAPDGSFRTLVGASDDLFGDAEIVERLSALDGIALGLREELYIINGHDVLKLEGGILERFAGTGEAPNDDDVLEGDGAPALTVPLNVPSGVAVAADGSVFISERDGSRVRVVTPDGLMRTVAGTGVPGFSGDGQRAVAAQLSDPRGLAIGKDGSIYIADQLNDRIRRVTPDGFIQTVVGGGDQDLREGQLPTQIKLDKPDGISLDSDGALYIATGSTVYKVAPGLAEIQETNDSLIPSEDGHTLYRFDSRGKHRETINAVTGITELEFGYDADSGLLTSVKDKNGLTTKIERDDDGVPGTFVGPFGQRTNLDLFEGRLKSITDPLDRTVHLEYNDAGLLSKIVSPMGAERVFQYSKDGLGILTRVEDNNREKRGNEPSNYFEDIVRSVLGTGNDLNINVKVQQAGGTELKFATTSTSEEIRRRLEAADGSVTESTDGRLTLPEVFADGTRSVSTFATDSGFGSQVLLPVSSVVTLPSGRVHQVTTNERKTLSDATNLLSATRWETTVEVNGRTAKTTFDRKDRSVQSTTPLGRASTTVLDELGRTIEQEAPGLGTVSFKYDDFGRIARVSRTAGKETRTQAYTYDDSDGFMRTVTDALDQTTQLEPDLVGRLLGVVDPSGARFEQTFDDDNRLSLVSIPGKKQHFFDYDGTSSLLKLSTPPSVEGPSPTDLPIGNARYSYNERYQPTLVERADGTTLAYEYDFAQRLKTLTTSGIALNYEYDNAGRVSTVHRNDGPSVAMEFDGPLPTLLQWTGPVEGKVTASYDDDLRLSQLTVNDQSTVSFGYDDDGAVVSATGNQQTLALTRDPATGFVTGTALGSVSTTQSHDGFGDLSALEATFQNKVNFSQTLERDALGRIIQLDETIGTTQSTTLYTYDAAGRLETVTRGDDVTTYEYDENGNRLSVSLNGTQAVAAEYDAQDRIVSHGDVTFEQTAYGELLRRSGPDGALELAYDGLGNLLTANVTSAASTKQIDYTMDGMGRRVGKQVAGRFSRAWLYRDQLRPVAEITDAGVFSHFVYASTSPGAPDFMLRAGVPFRFVKDHLGSVRLVVNATTGVVAQRLDYDEFGNVTQDSAPGFQPFGFAGGLYDADTALVRFGARDYDARVGRWLAKDPIGFEGGQGNLYVYVGNDPLNNTDPSGLISHPFRDWRVNCPGWLAWACGEEPAVIGDVRRHASDFSDGVGSYGVGLGMGAAHLAAKTGALGSDAEKHAREVDAVISVGKELAKRYPAQAARAAWQGFKARPGYAFGRLATGFVISSYATPYVGMPLSGLAGYGSVVGIAQRGALGLNFYRGLIIGT